MKPYYEHAGITIYHGDCREILPSLVFDVAITDPPYNVGIEYGAKVDDRRADYLRWCRDWFKMLRPSQTTAITPGIANIGLWYQITPPDWVLAWNKPGAMGRCSVGFNNWEPVLVWGKPPTVISDSFTAAIVPDPSVSGHPCPKPLRWGLNLVNRLSRPGAVIVDPFLGSGTIAVAAKESGRKAIGIDVEERFCETAAKRLAQEVLDLGA